MRVRRRCASGAEASLGTGALRGIEAPPGTEVPGYFALSLRDGPEEVRAALGCVIE